MQTQIHITVPYEPTPKARPRARAFMVGKQIRTQVYNPTKTTNAEVFIRDYLITHGIEIMRDCPLYVLAIFYRTRPKHLPKRVTLPIQKPDLDNYEKLVLDACEKFAYENDSQITTKVTAKRFADPGKTPRIELFIEIDRGAIPLRDITPHPLELVPAV